MTKTVQRRTRDALLLVLLVPALLGAMTLWLERRNDENLRWVAHTQEVLRSVNRIVAQAYQAESEQRGFLITGDNSYLERYHKHSAQEQIELLRFKSLTADNQVQRHNAEKLLRTWNLRAQHMDAVLALRASQGAPPQMFALMGEGRKLMDSMSDVAVEMSAEEIRLLRIRTWRQRRTEAEVVGVFASGVLINLLLLYWAYQLVKKYGIARDLAEMEIRRANSELERRVQERTTELQTTNDKLVRSNEDLTRFAYVASHDLQEPLRTVGSYAGLLARRYEGKLDAQADKYIGFIVSGAKRMQNMVQDLLMYSRTGTQQLTFSYVDLNAVLEIVKQDLRVMIAESGGKVVSGVLPEIEGDAGKLGLVLQNLISNGLKFRSPERAPVVRVEAKREESEWLLTVSDNGIGFDPQYASRIFVIFQRLHQVGEYAGTGIGLAICKRIVEGHGGRIWAQSEPGSGSTFFVAIPVHLDRVLTSGAIAPSINEVPKG